MVQERRRTTAPVTEQLSFARDVVGAANARYASGTAPQSDVIEHPSVSYAKSRASRTVHGGEELRLALP
jgi:hypothetical protein